MVLTESQIQEISARVRSIIRSESKSVGDVPEAETLDGVLSLPALRSNGGIPEVVRAPISLLSKAADDATEAAKVSAQEAANTAKQAVVVVNKAIDDANDATKYAQTAAETANHAANSVGEALVESFVTLNNAIDAAKNATDDAKAAAQSSVRKITVKDKKGQTIDTLTPGAGGNVDLSMTGGGSGSGFFNVTHEIPLSSGFYAKETAIAALAGAGIDDAQKAGMIITFEVSAGKWLDYRFEGTSIVSFLTPSAWKRYGGGDAIKKVTVTIGTNTQELIPDELGNTALDIPKLNVDKTLTEGGTNPVEGGAIAKAISQLESQFGVQIVLNTIGEGDDKVYSLSLIDKNGEVLNTTETFSGGGGSGSAVGTKVILTRITENPTIKFGDIVKLNFFYDQIDTSNNSSTGNAAKATITIVFGATSNTFVIDVTSGSTTTLDVTKYLGVGNNTVRVRVVTNDESQQVSSISWTVKTIQLTLASSFNVASLINQGNIVSVPFSLTGSGDKTLRMFLDGVDKEDRTISTSSANGSFQINTYNLTHGSHSVQLIAELEQANGSIIRSNSIYFDIAVRVAGNNTPIFASRFDYPNGNIIPAGQRPYLPTKQYDVYTLVYAAYNPNETPTQVNVFENDKLVSSTSVAFIRTELSVRAMTSGNISCRIVCGTAQYTYSLVVAESDLAVTEPTDNMTLKLSAMGRSNNDINRNEWNFNSIKTIFEGFKWGGDGWIDNALRLTDDARATVQFQPLLTPAQNATGAMSFMIRFKVTNIMNEAAEIIKCMDASGAGFVITTQEAKFVSRGNSTVTTKFAAGEIYNIGIVAYPKVSGTATEDEKLNDNMLYLYINGILSGGVQRGASDSIYQQTPQYITMGSNNCTLDVYSMRAYSVQLTDSQMLDAYMIDLGGADELIAKYNENDILDDNGQVNIDSLTLPYLIVTGQADNGVPMMIQAAVNNNKDPKYDVDEIMFIHPDDQSRNFKCVGGCIRLQGTSSLAYPTKNYRIYFKNASKVAGDFYLGCDRHGVGGIKQVKAVYSHRNTTPDGKIPAPVDCFCLKADFAESSSSHNTGLTRVVHNVMKAANELTPAQAHAAESYKYDVRTCIDGYPCLVFYRNTVNEQPTFLGKYNFNNDKSTEAVFGFIDIPGYHDQSWIQNKFGGKNPTECWEFLNNDYPMGSFLDDDFTKKDEDGKPHWMKMFEARFPDDANRNAGFAAGDQPTYLKALVQWVKSTNTAEAGLTTTQAEQRKTKFKTELQNYFDVNYLCDYFMFTEVFGCVDQRVKNMMLGFWYKPEVDKVLGYMIFYDGDTILGVRNDGRLKYNWDLDQNTTDPELSTPTNIVYAYAGHNSVLWNNLRELFPNELAAAYLRIRERMSNDFLFNVFDTEQSSQFNERIFNMDALNKYVTPKTKGVQVNQNGNITTLQYSYLEAMQGSRKAHRRWWLTNRLSLFDAKYMSGQYKNTDLTFKGNSAAGATIRAWAARDFYFAFVRESAVLVQTAVAAGAQWSYTYNQVANVGTIFHFFGGEYASKIDLSDWGGFTDLSIPRLMRLEELILGKAGKTYGLSEIAIGDKLPMLRKFDVRNYNMLPSLDLSKCTRLEEIQAGGCTSLATINFAEGCPLAILTLPNGFQMLTLRSLPKLTRSGITIENRQGITGLWIENCPQLDGFALMKELLFLSGNKLHYVRITRLNLSGNGSDLQAWYAAGLGGIDAQGNTTTKCKITGTYMLTKYLDDAIYLQLTDRFDELNIRQPQYTMIEFNDLVSDDKNITNLDNNTGYNSGTDYKPSGHILKIMSGRHRVLGKQTVEGTMTICQLHDENSNYYSDAADITNATPAKLDSTEGDVWMYEPKYWYKGINDYLKNKKYSCFSSNPEMPDRPNATVYSFNDLLALGNVRTSFKLVTGNPTVTSSTVADANYSICTVGVAGRKKVRFPTTLGTSSICSVFADDAGNIISNVNVPTLNHKFSDGMYLIADIPQNATRLNFTILKTAEFDCVVLSDSDKIEDMEPDWVEHPACLTGVFEATAIGSSLYSAITGDTNVANFTQPDFSQFAKNRKLQLIDWEMHKDVANLFFAYYGRRDSQAQCGYGQYNYSRIIGGTSILGMQDTLNPDNKTEYSFYIIKNAFGEISYFQISNSNCLGYENLYGNKCEWMDKVSIPNATVAEYYKFNIVMPDGTTRKVKAGTTNGYITGIVHQKYMDIICAFVTTGSETTYYCDEFTVSASAERRLFRSGVSYGAHAPCGVSYAIGIHDSIAVLQTVGSRLAFRGKIVKAASVAAYKALKALW